MQLATIDNMELREHEGIGNDSASAYQHNGESAANTAPPETIDSSPDSTSAAQSATKAAKDRHCPFCGQAFTSSSLGRHLDLYIKPKNPKPPDGIHHVEEIKKIRGNITRRQPRTGGRAEHRRSNDSAAPYDEGEHMLHHAGRQKMRRVLSHIARDSPIVSPVNSKDIHEGHTVLNQANWQATGVINNLPPRLPSRNDDGPVTGQAQRIHDMRHDASGNRIQRPEYENESMWKAQQDAELGRAAEMALREVIGSLEAAHKRTEAKTLFDDFDFFSHSFPGLCLAILPAPSTLFSPTPFPSAESWTLGPPGLRQFETMTRFVNERCTARRRLEYLPDSVIFKHHTHLSGSWEHWQNMSENDRASAWNLEILRTVSRIQGQKKRLKSELEQSQQRIHHLELEYDRLSRCQLPREYLMHPPNTIPISTSVTRELKSSQFGSEAAEMNYDAEALINKWKATIKAATRPSRVVQQTSGPRDPMKVDQGRHDLRDAMVMNGSVWNVNGPMPRNITGHMEPREGVSIAYETPPNPGAVVGADDEEEEDASNADADAAGEVDDPADTFALTKRLTNDANAALLNANGKRPLAPTITTRGKSATQIYREHIDDQGG